MNALNFLEYFVYEMKSADIKPNLKMLNLSKHLLSTVPLEQHIENSTINTGAEQLFDVEHH